MKRQIESVLIEWKNRPLHKPLVMRGARQVGKTWSVTRFGREQFRYQIILDLEKDRNLHKIFGSDLSARHLKVLIEASTGQPLVPGETLLFLDEIQACPRALMALRYFHEEMPDLHVVAAGSLLEFALEDISFPVGRVEFEWMRPLSFEEFLWAAGMERLAGHIPSLAQSAPVPDAIHGKLLDQLKLYAVIGGMPEAVVVFSEKRSLAEVSSIHRSLAAAYLQDFAKHSPRANRDCLQQVFERLPRLCGCQIKYSSLDPESRTETVKICLRVLEQACILQAVRSTTAQGLPLGASASAKVFKAVFLDVGLMQHVSGLPAKEILTQGDLLAVYRGAVAEQLVGQQLLSWGDGSENNRLYYWRRAAKSSEAEVDFMLSRRGEIIPVEVKSGPAGRLRSLQVFLTEHPACRRAVVLSSENVRAERRGKLHFLPLYARL
ncbi:MAG: ATP-binding protein [Elusimicrobia bacterium]|nr:ATP-binding protein [Elusimicrobiota bacterium]